MAGLVQLAPMQVLTPENRGLGHTFYVHSVTGASTVYTSFKPNRIVLTEQIIATFTNASGVASVVAGESATAADIMLSGAFSGSLNTFPNAPSATRSTAP